MFLKGTQTAVQDVNIPGMSFSHIRSSTGAVNLNLQGCVIEYDELSLTLKGDLEVLVDLYNVMKSQRDEYGNARQTEQGFEATLFMYKNDQVQLKYLFHGCRLQSVGDISLSSTDQTDLKVSCTISYDYYDISNTGVESTCQ